MIRLFPLVLTVLILVVQTVSAQDSPSESETSKLVLKYHDGKADGKKSIAGTGEMIRFSRPSDSQKLKGIRLHAARYGTFQAPKEDVEISIVSEDEKNVLHTEKVPYEKFVRGDNKWVPLVFKKPVVVEKEFWVILNFNAAQTKGVFVSYDTSTDGKYSKVGLPGQPSTAVSTGGDWMVEAMLTTPEL